MRVLIGLVLSVMLIACNKKKIFDGPNVYSDNFSSYNIIEDLIDGDNKQWSFFQTTRAENQLSIDTVIYHSLGKSFKSEAVASSDELGASKASINKQFMAFWEGETVSVEVWYYIEGTASADWLFLFDLEEKTSIGAGPGMRLALVDNQLLVEHKYPNPNIEQPDGKGIKFPRNTWVKVRFEAKLSQKEDGYVKVWQNDLLIIEQNEWQTLPKDLLYAIQGTKGMYSQIEFGVTANSRENAMTVYVDDIDVKIID